MHLDIICSLAVTQGVSQTLKFLHQQVWWKNNSGSIWTSTTNEYSQTIPCICIEWMWEAFHVGLGPQPMHLNIIYSLTLTFLKILPQQVWWNWNDDVFICLSTTYDYSQVPCIYVWSGCGNHSMWVWGLNQCTLTSFIALGWPRKLAELWKICANKYGGRMTVDPSEHPQHMNILKQHLAYVLSGCGKHSMWIWGLNQCTLTSYVASH